MGMRANTTHTLLLVFFVSVTILILSTNEAFAATTPTAVAGAAQLIVNEGDPIQLDGSGSNVENVLADPNGYKWTYVSGPKPSPFKGMPCSGGSCTVDPSFTSFVPKPGNAVMTFSLTVTNATGTSVADEVMISIMGTAHKHSFTPNASGEFKQNLGQIITGKAFGIKIANPGSLVSGSHLYI